MFAKSWVKVYKRGRAESSIKPSFYNAKQPRNPHGESAKHASSVHPSDHRCTLFALDGPTAGSIPATPFPHERGLVKGGGRGHHEAISHSFRPRFVGLCEGALSRWRIHGMEAHRRQTLSAVHQELGGFTRRRPGKHGSRHGEPGCHDA